MSAQLTVEYHRSNPRDLLFAFALRVVVTDAVEMPKEVFVFQRGAAAAPAAGETVKDNFICIADPVDLQEIPVNAPDIANEIPYYRLSEVTLLFRSKLDMESTKTDIANDLGILITTMNSVQDFSMVSTETATYPEV